MMDTNRNKGVKNNYNLVTLSHLNGKLIKHRISGRCNDCKHGETCPTLEDLTQKLKTLQLQIKQGR